ncbi:hypothetical protein GGX14DRAFT_643357 [Mycena pura]|uniref:Uncharacterized protein n=1 Tax=Mycena pura TaxID=153505 RepID=A0AAD6YCW4_9AGAR|nr:hypothetical protein GGX14DRAFT_643357 [Mycena pura]
MDKWHPSVKSHAWFPAKLTDSKVECFRRLLPAVRLLPPAARCSPPTARHPPATCHLLFCTPSAARRRPPPASCPPPTARRPLTLPLGGKKKYHVTYYVLLQYWSLFALRALKAEVTLLMRAVWGSAPVTRDVLGRAVDTWTVGSETNSIYLNPSSPPRTYSLRCTGACCMQLLAGCSHASFVDDTATSHASRRTTKYEEPEEGGKKRKPKPPRGAGKKPCKTKKPRQKANASRKLKVGKADKGGKALKAAVDAKKPKKIA